MARFWLEVTMITCSIPAATASSTAYWMTGLSTSGSISFGWAFVAGRKRVPHPAAGKTAFRTRMKPRSMGGCPVRRGYHRVRFGPVAGPRPGARSDRGQGPLRRVSACDRPREAADRGTELLRLVEVRQVGRPADQETTGVGCRIREGRLARSEEQVVLTVDQQAGAWIGRE